VRLHDAADLQTVETWLRNHNVTVVGSGGRKIRIRAAENAPVLDDVGQLPEVDVVAEYVKPKLFNDFARQLLGIDGAHAPQFPKDGSGQIVAVADTGIDENHPDFNGRILKAVARGRNNDASDPNGHGTHVAGSVLGDGSASGGRIKGVAPKAQLFFQSLLDADGDLGGLPVDLNELFEEAYAAGARIHNNSWGSETKSMYTMNSEEVDEFVRRHPDMLIVIAAGNEGTAANPVKSSAGFVDWLSIGSPASCKNALTVGASRSSRTDGPYGGMTYGQGWRANFPDTPIADQKISGDPNGLAAFSSRGPCDDRRIKPDVVAPGTDILSVKSSKAPDENFWGPHDDHYAFDGGTSMATPLVAGCAALIRQYYVDDRHQTPSAALLKATIINSTTWLTSEDAIAPSNGNPNYHQGYGLVNMANAIPNPANPQLTLQFVDNWQDQASQFVRTGQRKRYQFNLASAGELRLCLAYTDRAARGLQNNLNLVLQNVNTSQKWMGNADLPDRLVLPDPDNNVEAIRIPNAAAGAYLVQVFVGNLLASPQDFALVVTGSDVSALNEI
jgi:subtilisin family serine protease